MEKKELPTFVGKNGSRTEGHGGAYSATRRITLHPAALSEPYGNALLRQQAQENARGPPRGQILELPAADGNPGPSQGHLNF